MFDAIETDREFCVVTEYAQGELFDILQGIGLELMMRMIVR